MPLECRGRRCRQPYHCHETKHWDTAGSGEGNSASHQTLVFGNEAEALFVRQANKRRLYLLDLRPLVDMGHHRFHGRYQGDAGEGIAQLIFLQSDSVCAVSYRDKNGKYQAQLEPTAAKL